MLTRGKYLDRFDDCFETIEIFRFAQDDNYGILLAWRTSY
jgi:hypothetical protein